MSIPSEPPPSFHSEQDLPTPRASDECLEDDTPLLRPCSLPNGVQAAAAEALGERAGPDDHANDRGARARSGATVTQLPQRGPPEDRRGAGLPCSGSSEDPHQAILEKGALLFGYYALTKLTGQSGIVMPASFSQ